MIAAKAKALVLWAALVVGVGVQDGVGKGEWEEARVVGRAAACRSAETGPV